MVPRVIAYSPDPKDGCSWYRSTGPLAAIAKRGEIQLTHAHSFERLTWAEAAGHHIGFMQRPCEPRHANIARIIKGQMPLWIDFDDDLFTVLPDSASYEYFSRPEIAEGIAAICGMADAITVSTEPLRVIYQQHARTGVEVQVIPNAWNDGLLGDPWCVEKPQDYNRIVFWRGSQYHQQDLLTYRDAIAEVANTVGKDWRWVFMGAVPWQLNGMMRAEYLPAMDIMEYHRTIRDLRPAVMMVPLAFNRFNNGKSDAAWLEAAGACGSVGVVPGMESWAVPGTRWYASVEGFGQVLGYSIKKHDINPARTQLMGQDAVHHIKVNLLLSDVNRTRLDIINQLIGS